MELTTEWWKSASTLDIPRNTQLWKLFFFINLARKKQIIISLEQLLDSTHVVEKSHKHLWESRFPRNNQGSTLEALHTNKWIVHSAVAIEEQLLDTSLYSIYVYKTLFPTHLWDTCTMAVSPKYDARYRKPQERSGLSYSACRTHQLFSQLCKETSYVWYKIF